MVRRRRVHRPKSRVRHDDILRRQAAGRRHTCLPRKLDRLRLLLHGHRPFHNHLLYRLACRQMGHWAVVG